LDPVVLIDLGYRSRHEELDQILFEEADLTMIHPVHGGQETDPLQLMSRGNYLILNPILHSMSWVTIETMPWTVASMAPFNSHLSWERKQPSSVNPLFRLRSSPMAVTDLLGVVFPTWAR